MKQAVLGATGNVGGMLVNELLSKGVSVKALNRSWPKGVGKEGVEFVPVDAEKPFELTEATKDVDVLYSTIAIPYSTDNWTRSWPPVTRHIIDAAKANKCKVVFLDNVYMYGRVEGPMTENSPVRPLSKKGEIRAYVAQLLLEAMQKGEINAVIARSADFYGPHTRMSDGFFRGALEEGVINWIGSLGVLRTWSYTIDNAKALAILGNDARADGQIWHMPAAAPMKGTEFISLAGKVLGKDIQAIPFPGQAPEARERFAKEMPELAEMMYQYNYDYNFNSDKFQQAFGMQPTPYEIGFKHVFDSLRNEQ